jgi:hypothetical protein
VSQANGPPQRIGAFIVPAGYKVGANGVFQISAPPPESNKSADGKGRSRLATVTKLKLPDGPSPLDGPSDAPSNTETEQPNVSENDSLDIAALIGGEGVNRPENPAPLPPGEREEETQHRKPLSDEQQRKFGLKQISPLPIWISRWGNSTDGNEDMVELTFATEFGTVKTLWAPLSWIIDKYMIKKLGTHGAPIHSENAKDMLLYFAAARITNGPTFPIVHLAPRSGCYQLEALGGHWGWLIGSKWIGVGEQCVVADPRATSSYTQALTTSGDFNAWWSKYVEIANLSVYARWLVNASFAAPLLRIVRHRTFFVHHWGDSGKGKTAIAKFAMTVWGDPSGLMATFNATQISMGEQFAYVTDLPILFDELQAADAKHDPRKLIYDLCLERGRGRAGRSGGLAKSISDWAAIIRTTGEQELITADLGGQRNRVLQLDAAAMTDADASALHAWMDEGHFGHAGTRFLATLAEMLAHGGEESIRRRYKEILDALQNKLNRRGDQRVAHLAVIALAQTLVPICLLNVENEGTAALAIEDALKVAETIFANDDSTTNSVAEKALQTFRDLRWDAAAGIIDMTRAEGRARLQKMDPRDTKQIIGFWFEDEFLVTPTHANRLLKQAGIPTSAAWKALKQGGHLVLPKTADGNIAVIRKIKGKNGRYYAIKMSSIDIATESEIQELAASITPITVDLYSDQHEGNGLRISTPEVVASLIGVDPEDD